MALDKQTLTDDLVTVFDTAQEESWTKRQVATAMADAVDRFVRGGAVDDVDVTDGDRTLHQTGKAKIS